MYYVFIHKINALYIYIVYIIVGKLILHLAILLMLSTQIIGLWIKQNYGGKKFHNDIRPHADLSMYINCKIATSQNTVLEDCFSNKAKFEHLQAKLQ